MVTAASSTSPVLRAGEAEGIDIGGPGLDELRALWPGNPGSGPNLLAGGL